MSGPLSALVLASAWCGALGWEAACQCTTDGWSGGEDYVPEDAEFFSTGEKPYRFKGCGAHTEYLQTDNDVVDFQVAGYPFRWCFVKDPSECTMEVENKNVWPEEKPARWRKCDGQMCEAREACAIYSDSSEIASTSVASMDDWSDCCAVCGSTAGCVAWSFDASSCKLFGSELGDTSAMSLSDFPAVVGSYCGWVGHDDEPKSCTKRNHFDTCDGRPFKGMFISGCFFTALGVVLLLCYWVSTREIRSAVPSVITIRTQSSKTETRTRSTKNGTETYHVTITTTAFTYDHGAKQGSVTQEGGRVPCDGDLAWVDPKSRRFGDSQIITRPGVGPLSEGICGLFLKLLVGWFLPGVLFASGFAQMRDEDGTQMIGEFLFGFGSSADGAAGFALGLIQALAMPLAIAGFEVLTDMRQARQVQTAGPISTSAAANLPSASVASAPPPADVELAVVAGKVRKPATLELTPEEDLADK